MDLWFLVAIHFVTIFVLYAGFRSIRRGLKRLRLGSYLGHGPIINSTDTVASKSLLFIRKPRVDEIFSKFRERGREFASISKSDIAGNALEAHAAELSYGLAKTVRTLSLSLNSDAFGKTVVCNVAVGEKYQKSVDHCLESQRLFAEANGFDYVSLTEAPLRFDRPISWLKIALLAKLLSAGYSRILYIDADAMVTNLEYTVTEFFERLEKENKPILVTEDHEGINFGVAFIHNCPAAFDLLDLIWLFDVDVFNGTWEQFALKTLMEMSNEVKDTISIEPVPKRFNSFPVERALFHPTNEKQFWSEGDFICHFSGLRSPDLDRYIANYAVALKRGRPIVGSREH